MPRPLGKCVSWFSASNVILSSSLQRGMRKTLPRKTTMGMWLSQSKLRITQSIGIYVPHHHARPNNARLARPLRTILVWLVRNSKIGPCWKNVDIVTNRSTKRISWPISLKIRLFLTFVRMRSANSQQNWPAERCWAASIPAMVSRERRSACLAWTKYAHQIIKL